MEGIMKRSQIKNIDYILTPFGVDIRLCNIDCIGRENQATMRKLVGRIICDVPLIYQAYQAESGEGIKEIGPAINNKYWFAPTVGQIADALKMFGEDASSLENLDRSKVVLLNVAAFQSVEAAIA
jgi:hypothetical protein